MIPFEQHFLCNTKINAGQIKLDSDSHSLCYQISTDQQQRYYYIAITEKLNDGYFIRRDLGQWVPGTYNDVIKLIPRLPELFYNSEPIAVSELRLKQKEMQQDFFQLQKVMGALLEDFRKRWL